MSGIATGELPLRYKPDGSSASGGFSDVIFCLDQNLDRKVAIKTVQDPAEDARLRDEIQALLSMRSKHVVQVFDLVQMESKNIGIVLEHIDGDDLLESDYPNQSTENYLKTLWQIASGISDIHDAGIIHRDVKPNNMKLDCEGVLKIFDFGLSRDSEDGAATVGFKGTPGFAAPELFSHGAVTFTKAIDVYAFGAVALYLSGVEFPAELKMMPPLSLVSVAFPDSLVEEYPDLASLFKMCFAQDPEKRPSMGEIKMEIERYLLKDRHQALVVMNGCTHSLNASKQKAVLSVKGMGEFNVSYDGLRFYLDSISGEVYMNNIPITSKTEMAGSCVVAIGAPVRKAARRYITFDISYPEVTL